jgi:hypothetical protein
LSERRSLTEQQIAAARLKLEESRKRFVAIRDEALESMKEKQERASVLVAEVQRSVQDQKSVLASQTGRVGLRGQASYKIDRGLVQLEHLVQDLRYVMMGRQSSDLADVSPAVYEEIEEEANRIIKSDFFKTIMNQLKKEKENSA